MSTTTRQNQLHLVFKQMQQWFHATFQRWDSLQDLQQPPQYQEHWHPQRRSENNYKSIWIWWELTNTILSIPFKIRVRWSGKSHWPSVYWVSFIRIMHSSSSTISVCTCQMTSHAMLAQSWQSRQVIKTPLALIRNTHNGQDFTNACVE